VYAPARERERQVSDFENHKAPKVVAALRTKAREQDRIRFAQVLADAADFLERHGELPDAVRWLRKEADAWRPGSR
jgi:hypothetical protein